MEGLKDVISGLTRARVADAERIEELEAELTRARASWAEERRSTQAAQYERLVALDDKETECRALQRKIEELQASLDRVNAEGTGLVRSVASSIWSHPI